MSADRFDPITYFDQGGSGLGEMEPRPDGEWVRWDDYEALCAAIELHCRGAEIPTVVALKCPRQAAMLNGRLKAQTE